MRTTNIATHHTLGCPRSDACHLTRARVTDAVPILYNGNGHYYDVISAAVTFPTALRGFRSSLEVSSKFYYPHLLTINSYDEAYFIHTTLGVQEAWLAASDENKEGEWRWVDGPEAGLIVSPAFWLPGEPNNYNSSEVYATTYANGWFDVHSTATQIFVLEYELQHSSGCTS